MDYFPSSKKCSFGYTPCGLQPGPNPSDPGRFIRERKIVSPLVEPFPNRSPTIQGDMGGGGGASM
jgi:hypothetical protein